nr:Chain C, Pyruvate dehydrogenase phosphatase regulatory subunit, mitochondrial [Mus musculus]
IGPRALDVL